MKERIEWFSKIIICSIVDNPDEVLIDVNISTKNVIVNISTSKYDRGKVIGKKGTVIEAISRIIQVFKNKEYKNDSRKVVVEIIEGD